MSDVIILSCELCDDPVLIERDSIMFEVLAEDVLRIQHLRCDECEPSCDLHDTEPMIYG